ncbi:hypothetical protein DYY67_0544 [Candidatus Nitrosotalea sp. TS]|uniref:hypothetical protein n=1 Tax=Candidatus Nitrosotalea sp. TS TaxID=2341020 RepID=UPI00140DD5AD|nr:hypothetical protein [Candidatus Nitrosotalea sp. TS]NHI02505.1 hypothetical protein [Candidatus Nitrosotalea sp. TS]
MTSAEHQKMLNSLAITLESQGITITHIDIAEMPEYFDEKYRSLPKPKERDGQTPDLEGMKGALRHLGEVKTYIKDDPNINAQLKAFTGREMNGKDIPLHIAVPKELKKELEKKLYKLGLYEKCKKGSIRIWS